MVFRIAFKADRGGVLCLCRGFFDEEEDGKPFKPGGRLGDIEDDNVEEEDEEIHVKASFALGR